MKLSTPKIFYLDSAGALLTAFLTGVILTEFEYLFGMPVGECYILGGVAVIFSLYSLLCGLFLRKNHAPFLKIIAISNLIYCLITTGFVIYQFPQLTWLGVVYFLIENIIVSFVVALEWRTANAVSNR